MRDRHPEIQKLLTPHPHMSILVPTDGCSFVEENKVGTNVSIKVAISNFFHIQTRKDHLDQWIRPFAQ